MTGRRAAREPRGLLLLAVSSLLAAGCASKQPAPPPAAPKAPARPAHEPLEFGPSHVGPVQKGVEATRAAIEALVLNTTVSEEPEGELMTVRVFSGDERLYVVLPDEHGRVGRIRIESPMMSWDGVSVDSSYQAIADVVPAMACKSGAGPYARDLLCRPADAANIAIVFENGTGEHFAEALTPDDQRKTLAGKSARLILWDPP